MSYVNKETFYVSSDTYIKDKDIPIKPNSIFRQELATWEYTDSVIKRTIIIRSFDGNKHIDSYILEPIAFKKSH